MIQSILYLKRLVPNFIKVAQNIYDQWQQNENGHDEEYGYGGICHEIADSIVEVLSQNNIEASSVSAAVGEVHVYVVAKLKEGVYEINIPPEVYETGSAYTWKKKPNVKFQTNDVIINLIDKNPEKFEDYLENNSSQEFKQWLSKSNFIVRRKWPNQN